MKKTLLYLMSLGLLVFTAGGCDEDDTPDATFPDTADKPTFSVTSPTDNTSLLLNVLTPNDSVSITWEALPGDGAVTYAWIADELDGDFSTPVLSIAASEAGSATRLTLSQSQIDEALDGAGFARGERADLKWTVRATRDGETFQARTPARISISRFGFLVTFRVTVPTNTPSTLNVFIAGEMSNFGAPSNWQQPGTNADLQMTSVGGRVYEITFPVSPGTTAEYKYFLATTTTPNWGNGEQQPNATLGSGCSGVSNRSVTFPSDATDNLVVNDTVGSWEGYCVN